MSEITEQVVAELCSYLGNDTCTTTETADKLIALVSGAIADDISRMSYNYGCSRRCDAIFSGTHDWMCVHYVIEQSETIARNYGKEAKE